MRVLGSGIVLLVGLAGCATSSEGEAVPASTSLAAHPSVAPTQDPCSVPAGPYTVRYTKVRGGVTCTPGLERHIDSDGYPENDASQGCSIEPGKEACEVTVYCSTTDQAMVSKTQVTTTVKDGKVTGTFAAQVQWGASMISDCEYTLEWVRR